MDAKMEVAEQKEYRKRQTAYKIQIKDIEEGKFAKEGEYLNYFHPFLGFASRVNVVGIVVSLETSNFFSGAIIDDGTGRASVRIFEKKEMFEGINVGDFINVIGRVRLYNDQRYVAGEIVRKTSGLWLEHRKKELEILEKIYKKNPVSIPKEIQEAIIGKSSDDVGKVAAPSQNEGKSKVESVMQVIRNLDSGNGAEISLVAKQSNIEECEKIIDELLKNGDIFEIMPGKIKVLE